MKHLSNQRREKMVRHDDEVNPRESPPNARDRTIQLECKCSAGGRGRRRLLPKDPGEAGVLPCTEAPRSGGRKGATPLSHTSHPRITMARIGLEEAGCLISVDHPNRIDRRKSMIRKQEKKKRRGAWPRRERLSKMSTENHVSNHGPRTLQP